VLIDTSATRLAARKDIPSQSMDRINLRCEALVRGRPPCGIEAQMGYLRWSSRISSLLPSMICRASSSGSRLSAKPWSNRASCRRRPSLGSLSASRRGRSAPRNDPRHRQHDYDCEVLEKKHSGRNTPAFTKAEIIRSKRSCEATQAISLIAV
jgi:hypothetical protein